MISLPTFRGVLSGFNPLSLSPALWLNDTGSDPSVWTDMSGNGRNVSQTDPTKQPSIVTSALNGKQVRRFDGANDNLRGLVNLSGMLQAVPGATIISAYKWVTDPTVVKVVVSITTGTSTSSARAAIAGGVPSQKLFVGGRRLDGDGFQTAFSSANNPTTYFVHSGVMDYANSDAFQYVNGSLDGINNTFQTNGNTDNTSSLAISIGASDDTVNFANVDIAEILVFPTALSTVNRQRVERYLSGKYAIAF